MTINPYEPSRTPQPLAIVPPEGPLDIEFELTIDDLVEFSLDHSHRMLERVNKGIIGCVGVLGAITVPCVAAAWFLTTEEVPAEDGLGLGIFAALCFFGVGGVFLWLFFRKNSSLPWGDLINRPLTRYLLTRGDTSTLTGRYWLRLDATEILERAPKMEHRIHLSAVQKIVITKRHLFIYISSLQAVVIPLVAFADSGDADVFVAAAEKRTGVQAIRI